MRRRLHTGCLLREMSVCMMPTGASKFGGSIYKYAGSHGCINLPPEVAKVVFENVKKNYPVLVYELPGTEKYRCNR